MILKTLGNTTWDKIKIGEIFADIRQFIEMTTICIKINKKELMVIDSTNPNVQDGEVGNYLKVEQEKHLHPIDINSIDIDVLRLYKLPQSVQKLWGEQ